MNWIARDFDEGSYRPDPDSYDSQEDFAPYEAKPNLKVGVGLRVDTPRKVAAAGSAKTAQMFTYGGALDSQTTDSQWETSLTADQHESLVEMGLDFKEGKWFTSDGEPMDVSLAFDPVSPCLVPGTPTDSRVPKSESQDENWVGTQLVATDHANPAIVTQKAESLPAEDARAMSDIELDDATGNKENIPPQATVERQRKDTAAICDPCRGQMTSLLTAFKHMMVFQEKSADLFQKQADLARETSMFLNSAIEPLVLALDATKKAEHEAREADVMMYMGSEVHGYRSGNWVTYLHPDEPSQKVIAVECVSDSDLEGHSGPGKRVERPDEEDIDTVSGIGLAESTSDSGDDLPPLESESVEEGVRWTTVKTHPMMMYGDICEEIRHMSYTHKMYSTYNRCARC
ncbi:hypothetical protein QCA50_011931 [Cerrena zonata]|uniref:Uncharacterized protein n=1 Tax=Cerrena zonata TaxID=2478898 RepID=A0AAW0G060_9APHY